ncbi:uncharacterized protein LOC117807526 [Notolabrus celidotus]|uniref:uncharacterized protein LOC117807526 n=1 Tax=Notolabrus celidotus TaxID=1203425 RepID=UPI0014901E1D|nr:uncharacterized protein LOC117807526 [Notolabrus celidotus]
MTSPKFVLYLTCLVLGEIALTTALKSSSSVRRESRETGQKLTLQCFYEDALHKHMHWYKKTLEDKLEPISAVYKYTINDTFHGEFKHNPRFSLDAQDGKNHLTISDLLVSDSATYYCLSCSFCKMEVLETVHVNVKSLGFKVPAVIHQSESETIQPGGSVTLNCTVHTGSCDGEHSVYWFKDSEESQPGLIYTSGGKKDQCERNPDSQTHTCVYNLPMKNLDLSHAGTYHCAVVSCGHVLFGDGIKLDFKDRVDLLVLVYCLSGALIFVTLLVVVLAFSLYKMNKRIHFLSQEAQTSSSAPSARNLEGHREADNLFYAALSVNKPNTSRRQRNTTTDECVYSSVKQ